MKKPRKGQNSFLRRTMYKTSHGDATSYMDWLIREYDRCDVVKYLLWAIELHFYKREFIAQTIECLRRLTQITSSEAVDNADGTPVYDFGTLYFCVYFLVFWGGFLFFEANSAMRECANLRSLGPPEPESSPEGIASGPDGAAVDRRRPSAGEDPVIPADKPPPILFPWRRR